MICGGLLLTGYQLFSLFAGWPFNGLILAGGLIMTVGGVLAAMFVSHSLEE
jgi:hypothetical protein